MWSKFLTISAFVFGFTAVLVFTDFPKPLRPGTWKGREIHEKPDIPGMGFRDMPKKRLDNAVTRAVSADGVMGDTATVMNARFKAIEQEYKNNKIIIEILPNKNHPKYQKLMEEADHIKRINRTLKRTNPDMQVVKSESVYQRDPIKRRVSLREARDFVMEGIVPVYNDIEEAAAAGRDNSKYNHVAFIEDDPDTQPQASANYI